MSLTFSLIDDDFGMMTAFALIEPHIIHIISLLLMLFHTKCSAPLASTPVWEREFSSSEDLIKEFCRECRIVRKGEGFMFG